MGKFLYYVRAADPMMPTALSALGAEQSAPIEKTVQKVRQFLEYCALQEDAVITSKGSSMVLAVHSDAEYLNEPKVQKGQADIFSYQTMSSQPTMVQY